MRDFVGGAYIWEILYVIYIVETFNRPCISQTLDAYSYISYIITLQLVLECNENGEEEEVGVVKQCVEYFYTSIYLI